MNIIDRAIPIKEAPATPIDEPYDIDKPLQFLTDLNYALLQNYRYHAPLCIFLKENATNNASNLG